MQPGDMDFVIVYRWRITVGREDEFREAWLCATTIIRDACGSGGSALFRADDDSYVAIARWPDRATRERCNVALDEIARMSACVDQTLPGMRLTVLENLWKR